MSELVSYTLQVISWGSVNWMKGNRMRMKQCKSATSFWLLWLLYFLSTCFTSLWVCSILEKWARLLRCRWLLYLLICLYVCVHQLVWDVSVFAQRRSTSWRRFANLTQRAAFRHVCVFTDKARQLTHRENRFMCLDTWLLFFFFSFLYFSTPPLFFCKPSVFVVPEGKAKESQSRFFHSGPAEMEPAAEWRHRRCSRPFLGVGISLCLHSEWPAAPWCWHHLTVRH